MRQGRKSEMDAFDEMGVYEVVDRQMADGYKIIRVRWVDVQKGDAVKCRLVAMDFNNSVEDDLFAATPPLVATKLLLSSVASSGVSGPGRSRIGIIDVKRAFLYGNVEKNTTIVNFPVKALDLRSAWIGEG